LSNSDGGPCGGATLSCAVRDPCGRRKRARRRPASARGSRRGRPRWWWDGRRVRRISGHLRRDCEASECASTRHRRPATHLSPALRDCRSRYMAERSNSSSECLADRPTRTRAGHAKPHCQEHEGCTFHKAVLIPSSPLRTRSRPSPTCNSLVPSRHVAALSPSHQLRSVPSTRSTAMPSCSR
jgi:hypothetical protein